jgi:hypothetical protein
LTVFVTKIIVLLVARGFERSSIAISGVSTKPLAVRGEEVDRGRGSLEIRMPNTCEGR